MISVRKRRSDCSSRKKRSDLKSFYTFFTSLFILLQNGVDDENLRGLADKRI